VLALTADPVSQSVNYLPIYVLTGVVVPLVLAVIAVAFRMGGVTNSVTKLGEDMENLPDRIATEVTTRTAVFQQEHDDLRRYIDQRFVDFQAQMDRRFEATTDPPTRRTGK
jgi:hypothetical protein